MQQSLKFEQSMLKEREQRVRQIEEDVLDVNQIMRELNTLINQQGEAIGKCHFTLLCFITHSMGRNSNEHFLISCVCFALHRYHRRQY